jgi:hypothetical protein
LPPAADPPSTAPRAFLPCLPGSERGSREDDSIGITKSARADAIFLNSFLLREADVRSITLFSRLDCNLSSKKLASFSLPLLSLSLSHTHSHSLSVMPREDHHARGLWSCARPLEHVSCSWLSGRRRLSVAASTSTHLVRVSQGSRTILLDYALERFLEVGAHLLRGSSHQLNVRLDHSLRIFTKRAN